MLGQRIGWSTCRTWGAKSSPLLTSNTVVARFEHSTSGFPLLPRTFSGATGFKSAPIWRAMTGGATPASGSPAEDPLCQEKMIRERKAAMRKHIKSTLATLSESAVDSASDAVAKRVFSMPHLANENAGPGGAVSVYLSMPGELGTSTVLSELFKRGKKVYIPKVLGPASSDMRMFPLQSEDEVKSFPLTKWKIPEPSEELVLSREDGIAVGDIDVIIVPGMAFDARCNRLGHGKGYYDCFFERLRKSREEKGMPTPVTMGVCFDEQVVESVPVTDMDVPLDYVFTPSGTLQRAKAEGT